MLSKVCSKSIYGIIFGKLMKYQIIISIIFKINLQKNMGCSQSQLRNVQKIQLHEDRQFLEMRKLTHDESFQAEQGINRNNQSRNKENQHPQQHQHNENDEENRIKVKKARNFKIRPEHQKFIQNILSTNRVKAVTQYPQNAPKDSTPIVKRNSNSLYSKGEPFDEKNKNIEEKSETKGKIGYSKKQFEKMLNNKRANQHTEQLQQVGQRLDLQQLDSNATLRL